MAPNSASPGQETPRPSPMLRGRAFYESIGSPKFVVAPMVDQSEFAWRMLTRSFMSPDENAKLLAYTPMFHARLFQETERYRDTHFQATRPAPVAAAAADGDAKTNNATPTDTPEDQAPAPLPFLDGNPAFDRPLFVQFCANEPDHLLAAAKLAAPYCDAIDLNLGCPQGIARKGHYGAFLQEDQDLIYRLINTLHRELPIPVTAKIRILETKEETLAYARNVLSAGASILTVHGRRREQKGHLTGLADWEYIRFLRDSLPPETVIFANGNILQNGDIQRCLEATGADAVMSAEGNLSDPAIFARPPEPGQEEKGYWRGRDGKGGWRVDAVFRRYMDILHRHVLGQEPPARRPLFAPGDDEAWLQEQGGEEDEEGPARKKRKKEAGGGKPERATSPNLIGVRAHLFHLLRHFISRHTDIRDALARCLAGDIPAVEKVLDMVERRVADGLIRYEQTDGRSLEDEPEVKPRHQQPPQPQATGSAYVPGSEAPGQEKQQEGSKPVDDTESSVETVKACKRPWWVAQPIVRPLPKEALAKGSIRLSKKDKKKMEQEEKQQQKREDGAAAAAAATLPKPDGEDGPKEPAMDEKKAALTSDELVCG